jgi:hypothetical protein
MPDPGPDSARPEEGRPPGPDALFPADTVAPAAGTTAGERRRLPRTFTFSRALRTQGFTPAGDARDRLDAFLLDEPELLLLAGHHHGDSSYAVLFDSSATWDVPGTADLVAVHVVRNPMYRTFDFATAALPMVGLAQQWLVARGCPPGALALLPGRAAQPADEETTVLETRLRTSPGRYDLLDHYTYDRGPFESWALLRDRHPESEAAPVRLFIESADTGAGTYTLREGAFRDEGDAHRWLDDNPVPLPAPPSTARRQPPSRPAAIPPPGASGPRR